MGSLTFEYIFVFLATGILSNFNIAPYLFEAMKETAPITVWIVISVQFLINRIDYLIEKNNNSTAQ